MDKPKLKRGQSRTGWWLVEHTGIFITAVGIFLLNCLSLMPPIHILTEITRTTGFVWHILVLLAMLFTWIAIQIYYRLIRWLEHKRPLPALIYLLTLACCFGVFCLITAVPMTLIGGFIAQALIGRLRWSDPDTIHIRLFLLTPQITLVFITAGLMLFDRIMRRNRSVLTLP